MLLHTLSPCDKSILHLFYKLWWACATTSWMVTVAWPVRTEGYVQIREKFAPWNSWNMGYTVSHWTVRISLHACFPSWKCYWSPFIGHLLLITKTLAHRSTCKCLNVQGQAAVLCRTGSNWISRNPEVEGRKKKEWKATYGISSGFVSGLRSGSPILPPHSSVSRDTIQGDQRAAQTASPLYSKNKNTSASSQVRISL